MLTPPRTHIPRSKAVWLSAALLCWAPACNRLDPCGAPGIVKACACGAMQGARICKPDKTWGSCDCSGAIPLPAPGSASSGSGGAPASSGTGGRGGVKPNSGSGGGSAPHTAKDAGTPPKSDAGGTGSGGSGAIDAAVIDGGGSGGVTGEPMGTAYGACMTATDCQPKAECVITSNYPVDANVCAPACVDVGDCPVPDGTYDAVLGCVSGYCRLDCTPVLFAELLTCPSGMTCIAPLLGSAYCHDDGM